MKMIIQKGGTLLILIVLLAINKTFAQSGPPPLPALPDGVLLDAWEFSGTNFLSLRHSAPLSLTNVTLVPTWDGNGLQVDDTNAAWITYPVVEPSGHTNLDLSQGTIEMWFSPDWNSADGLGTWAPLLEVGTWNTNFASAAGAWGLYLSPDGSNICFSSQTNSAATNYLTAPINWNAGDWHQVVFTYSSSNSALYLEGQWVTNGPGVSVIPGGSVLSNGFAIGSDGNGTGLLQSRGLYNALATFSYQLDAGTISNDYADDSQYVYPLPSSGSRFTMDAPGLPGGLGGTNYTGTSGSPSYTTPSYTTNDFWLEALSLGTNAYTTNTNSLTVLLHGTISDVSYQLLSSTNFQGSNTVWAPEQYLIGSDVTNFTPAIISMTGRSNLFLKALAYTLDSDGDGLPDWWENKYSTTSFPLSATNADTGNTGIQDGDKLDSAGDGYSNLEKYQMGVAPGTWVTPQPPNVFSAVVSTNGTNAILTWIAAPGTVLSNTIIRGGVVLTNLSGSQTNFTDLTMPSGGNVSYQIEALYAGGTSAISDSANPSFNPAYTVQGSIVRGPLGALFLAATAIPQNVTAIRVHWQGGVEDYPIFDFNTISSQTFTPSINNDGSTDEYFDVPITNFTGGIFQIPTNRVSVYGAYQFSLQGIGSSGTLGSSVNAIAVTDWNGTNQGHSLNIPFMDGRTNIQQNINFLLRAVTATDAYGDNPLSVAIGYLPGGDFNVDYVDTQGTNYVYSGFYYEGTYYDYNSNAFVTTALRNEFQPFEQNYLYNYYQYKPGIVDTDLNLTNGVVYGVVEDLSQMFSTYSYVVHSNQASIPGLIDQNAYIHSFYMGDVYQPDYNNYVPDSLLFIVGCSTWFSNDLPYFSLTNNFKNAYGLTYQSIKYPLLYTIDYTNASPGSNFISSVGPWFQQVSVPAISTVGYYFARPGVDALPGESTFNVTNVSPSPIIIPFAQPFHLTAWAKQSVTNGYSGVYAYPQQYFDKAYLSDTNGNIATNQTGILSEYGDFFPTQPGKVFLTTKPDGATGTVGTNVLNVIKIQTDVNHDGIMDLTFSGPDNTSIDRPQVMWVNSDHDASGLSGDADFDVNAPDLPDYNCTNRVYGNGKPGIRSMRDLEDYARLWICGMPSLTNAGYNVTMSWTNISSGSPIIHLFQSVEANGGTLYLTDTNIAAAQWSDQTFVPGNSNAISYSIPAPGISIGTVSNGAAYTFPADYFTNGTTKHLLFEGAGIGKGQLILTVSLGTNVVAQTGTWLELKNVYDMFEHAHTENVTSGVPPSSLTSRFVLNNTLPADPSEAKQIIVFVHGINNSAWQAENTSESMFKRLYWSGYQGRFAAFRWPCAYLPFENSLNPFNYNIGEYYAWKSASAFKDYLTYLHNNTARLPNYSINIIAHSQGNVVASEALKQGAPFDAYILTQGAIPAHSYDTDTNHVPFLQKFLTAEAQAGKQTPLLATNGGYQGYFANLTGNLINFYNTNDFALISGTYLSLQANWEEDQRTQKPEAFFNVPSYLYDSTNQTTTAYYTLGSHYTVTDMQESKAMVARSRSHAIGAQSGTQGAINSSIDLITQFGFGVSRSEHSAQFARNIQTVLPYYIQITNSIAP